MRRVQVHIEAIIAEVSYDKGKEIGVEWQTIQISDGVFAASRLPTQTIVSDVSTAGAIASKIGQIGQGLSVGYFVGGELRALLSAFANDSNINVLSTPSLITMDNEEASIIVGQNIPLVTGSFTTNAGTGGGANNPFQTVQRQDIGIKLKVLPQINEGNAIKLKVTQEVSSVVKDTSASASGTATNQTFNKREIVTSVLVDDTKILVLGGLIQDDMKESISKVPFLGDLPLLGFLFQSTSTVINKKNLMVFLRPQILRDTTKSGVLTLDKYNYIRDKEQQFNKKGVTFMPNLQQPLMDSLPGNGSTTPANQSGARANGN
jgi:general secretion pathway protein D